MVEINNRFIIQEHKSEQFKAGFKHINYSYSSDTCEVCILPCTKSNDRKCKHPCKEGCHLNDCQKVFFLNDLSYKISA